MTQVKKITRGQKKVLVYFASKNKTIEFLNEKFFECEEILFIHFFWSSDILNSPRFYLENQLPKRNETTIFIAKNK